jgi:uncharacterized alkaline shock family protein YloU
VVNEKAVLANIRQNTAGRIEVTSRAIATTTANVVTRCYGVVGMAPRNLRDSVTHVLRPEDQYKGIEVHINADHIAIDLYVVIEYGTRIATVARNIMETVQYAVENALGKTQTTVNVHVQALRMEPNAKDEPQASRWRRLGTMGGLRGQRTDDESHD